MSTELKLRRPSEDATQEERRSYFTALRKALDEAGIGYGEEFVIVKGDGSWETPATRERLATGAAADDPGANGLGGFARDSKTSRRAALDNYPRSGTQRAKVLAAVMESGAGLTRDELSQALDMPPNVLTPRVKELIDGGWIEPRPGPFCGHITRRTRSGSFANVLYATEKAQTHGT